MKYRAQVRFSEVYQVDVEADGFEQAKLEAKRVACEDTGRTGRESDDTDVYVESIRPLP